MASVLADRTKVEISGETDGKLCLGNIYGIEDVGGASHVQESSRRMFVLIYGGWHT